jgi:2-amino-4-hydroxy-6-hydroxymethyldihydropteridine diphosphokinase
LNKVIEPLFRAEYSPEFKHTQKYPTTPLEIGQNRHLQVFLPYPHSLTYYFEIPMSDDKTIAQGGTLPLHLSRELAVGLGSNLGDRAELLSGACILLETVLGEPVAASSVWESEPWGYDSPNHYLNQVMVYRSDKSPADLLAILIKVEKQLGRHRREEGGMADRCIDLDLLWVDRMVLAAPEASGMDGQIIIPHPRMHLRRFVLEPLAEIRPEWLHPVLGITVTGLLGQCPDQGSLKRVEFELNQNELYY